ncbi:hypothetical protein AB0L41_45360 [Amycolatopsis mediterranei]|uniref:hypothetical protein n=1 Tax=Amycolatopsis mediterranei TaxID=33910 RepID=UPI00342D1EFB
MAIAGRTVVLDDATGTTAYATIRVLRARQAARIVLAVPVAQASAVRKRRADRAARSRCRVSSVRDPCGGRLSSAQVAVVGEDLCLEAGEAFVEESVVRAGGLEFLAEVADFLGEFADAALRGCPRCTRLGGL